MTNVMPAAAPAAQPMTEVSADPPTMKNAGRLNTTHGVDGLAVTIMSAVLFLLLVGGMLLAVMTNHGRTRRGFALHGLAGLAAFLVMAAVIVLSPWAPDLAEVARGLLMVGAPLAIAWLVIAVVGFAVGSLVQPPGKARRRA